jgi:uncharacterized cupin superfamily protein
MPPTKTNCIIHWDDVEKKSRSAGDIASTWTMLGEAAGTVQVGLRRIEVTDGNRTTALHVHGAEEEIFYVLGGAGLLYQGRTTCEVGRGDCIVHRPETDAHTLRGGPDGLDLLVFGTRVPVEICHLPRAGMAWAGPTVLVSPGLQNLWEKDAARGPLDFPPPGPRPENVVNAGGVPARPRERGKRRYAIAPLGRAAGAVATGLNLVTLHPGSPGPPQHCHSAEEEIFVVLDGEGVCMLGDDAIPVRRGHVVARPAGTGVAHTFNAGERGLTYLAYGTRVTDDVTYYPRSNKIYLRGIGVIGRIEKLDYWDGED